MHSANHPPNHPGAWWADLKVALALLTRLPMAPRGGAEAPDIARAGRVMPLAGALIGLVGAAAFWLSNGLGLPPLVSGLVAVAATILFTGATASLRGSANFANLAVGKFGLRALAQSMARELGARGVHVAHIIIDGEILSERYSHLAEERPPDSLLAPDDIAEAYYQLHRQPRSTWTHELDLRPWVEKF
ncbi:MAG: adenosylcobinamide-GDP ribazoletransferase [Proteobacteria bacterium]|nr:adenosylcobinamide-GDP ribazoletransferase [Pseudomonadota bacterium]